MALGAISEVWKTAFASELTRSGPRMAASTAKPISIGVRPNAKS
jgi:hypothetical protein